MFFSFDGIDGVGKSTQLQLFCDWLRERGCRVVTCRDPGSTPIGEQIRKLLLSSGEETPIGPRAEMLLYMAARAQLVDEVIRPALEEGAVVVSDRFLLANVAYQAHAGGLHAETVWRVGDVATEGLRPDCTLLLDMDPAEADKRINRERDRMEKRGADYREKLRRGFLVEAKQDQRVHVVDANRSVQAIQEEIRAIASRSL